MSSIDSLWSSLESEGNQAILDKVRPLKEAFEERLRSQSNMTAIIHASAPLAFPGKGRFEKLSNLPDDLDSFYRWSKSQKMSDEMAIEGVQAHFDHQLMSQFLLLKGNEDVSSWKRFTCLILTAARDVLGGPLLNHEIHKINLEVGAGHPRELWVQLSNGFRLLYPSDEADETEKKVKKSISPSDR